MGHLSKLTSLLSIVMIFACNSASAEGEENPEAYAALQNCLAEATGLADNGSYEHYCMEAYQASLQTRTEE